MKRNVCVSADAVCFSQDFCSSSNSPSRDTHTSEERVWASGRCVSLRTWCSCGGRLTQAGVCSQSHTLLRCFSGISHVCLRQLQIWALIGQEVCNLKSQSELKPFSCVSDSGESLRNLTAKYYMLFVMKVNSDAETTQVYLKSKRK